MFPFSGGSGGGGAGCHSDIVVRVADGADGFISGRVDAHANCRGTLDRAAQIVGEGSEGLHREGIHPLDEEDAAEACSGTSRKGEPGRFEGCPLLIDEILEIAESGHAVGYPHSLIREVEENGHCRDACVIDSVAGTSEEEQAHCQHDSGCFAWDGEEETQLKLMAVMTCEN